MAAKTHEEIEAQIRDLQAKRKAVPAPSMDGGDGRVGLGEEGHYDKDIYEMSQSRGKYDDYVTSIPATDEQDDEDDYNQPPILGRKFTAPLNAVNDMSKDEKGFDPLEELRRPRIADREDEYKRQIRHMIISPARIDPFEHASYSSSFY